MMAYCNDTKRTQQITLLHSMLRCQSHDSVPMQQKLFGQSKYPQKFLL